MKEKIEHLINKYEKKIIEYSELEPIDMGDTYEFGGYISACMDIIRDLKEC